MPIDRSKRHLTRLFRRSAKAATAAGGARAAEESAFWTAHDRAVTRSRDAAGATQRISVEATKQRAAVEGLAERSRSVSVRAHELAGTFGRITEVFERLGLVALNAGLEGARLGETAGRAVLLVSDEVRTHALRGGEAVRELSGSLSELSNELSQIHTSFALPRETSIELAEQSALAASALSDTERALSDLEARARQATGSDPETVRALSYASEQAQALIQTLGTLGDRMPPRELMNALRPMLEPLARILDEDFGDDGPEARERGERDEGNSP